MPFPMTFPLLARLAVPAILAIGAGLAGPSAFPVRAAGVCATPILSAVIDPGASLPLSPRIVLTADGLTLPAQGRFEWGDGQYGVARLDDGDGALGVVTNVQPVYTTAGTYTLELAVTDACGATTTLAFPVAVPLRLPAPAAIECPASVDASGFCVVGLGAVSTFTVTGGGPAGPWHWNASSAEGPADARSHRVFADDARPVHLQATAITPTGWLVTPVLQVVAIAPASARITAFSDPMSATADQPFDVGFTVPAGSKGGAASILVDDVKVADGTSASIRLGSGSHTITYVVLDLDGGAIQRQAVVVVSAPPPPVGLIGAVALTLLMIGAALRTRTRWRRRNRVAAASGPAPLPLVRQPRGTTP